MCWCVSIFNTYRFLFCLCVVFSCCDLSTIYFSLLFCLVSISTRMPLLPVMAKMHAHFEFICLTIEMVLLSTMRTCLFHRLATLLSVKKKFFDRTKYIIRIMYAVAWLFKSVFIRFLPFYLLFASCNTNSVLVKHNEPTRNRF